MNMARSNFSFTHCDQYDIHTLQIVSSYHDCRS